MSLQQPPNLTEFSLADAVQLLPKKIQPEFVTGFSGSVAHYHYGCDGFNDAGWGCGYRTCQTILHWLLLNAKPVLKRDILVPTLPQMQSALVAMGDKPASFVGSKDWIGCLEAAYLIDRFADCRCRIFHQQCSTDSRHLLDVHALKRHFLDVGCPVMMGGHTDAAAKTILAVMIAPDANAELLVLDPHLVLGYVGHSSDLVHLVNDGWLAWHSVESFSETHFYNLCLPII